MFIKFIIYAFGIFFILSLLFGIRTIHHIVRFIFGGTRKKENNNPQSSEKPASQDARIITYKKKEFETSAAEDVDFEEVKDSDAK